MFFFLSCIPLLGVLCHLILFLLLATSAYCTIDCLSIKGNVDSILTIGPWNNSLAILTTDLQLFQAKLQENPPRLQLSNPQSLAVLVPKLYGVLHKLDLTVSANLIQVNSKIEPALLLETQSDPLHINPSNGVKHGLYPVVFQPGAVWLSSQTNTFYAITGQTLQNATYDGARQINVKPVVFLSYTDTSVRVQSTSTATGNWQVKKAFNWQMSFYVLTTDSVYVFEESAVLSPEMGSVALLKISYEQFFNCTDSKEETTTNESRKTTDEKIKSKVTKGHSAHPISPVTTAPRWVNILLFAFFGILLLCIVVWLALCLCWMPKKKAPLKGGRVFLPGDISFDGGLVHIPTKSDEPKVAVPRSPKASPIKGAKTAFNSAVTKRSISPTKEQPGLRVATKMNSEMVKKIAARKALKRASSRQSGLKVKGESCRQVNSTTATKTK